MTKKGGINGEFFWLFNGIGERMKRIIRSFFCEIGMRSVFYIGRDYYPSPLCLLHLLAALFSFFFEGGVVNDETTRHLFVWEFVLFVFWRGFYSFQQTKRFSLLITCKGCINTSDSTKTTKRKGGTFLKRKKAFFWEERGKGEEGKEE